MKYEVSEVSSVRKKMTVTIPAETVGSKIEKETAITMRSARLKGFRAGKVPRNMIEKYYGPLIRENVASDLIKEHLFEAAKQADINPIATPVVDPFELKQGQDFVFTAQIEIIPKIDKVDFENIEIEVPPVDVTDKEIDETLDRLRDQKADLKKPDPDRPAKSGDYIVMDISMHLDGKMQGKNENVEIYIGEGGLPPDVDKALIGMKVGDEKKVETEIKLNPNDPASNKKAVYEIKLKDLKEKILPKLDDEFAKDVGKENMEALRADIRKDIADVKEKRSRSLKESEIQQKLREKNPIELPPSLVEMQRQRYAEDMKQRFKQWKMPFNEERFKDELEKTAKETVHSDILLTALAEIRKIDAQEHEVDKEIEKIAKSYGEEAEKIKAIIEQKGARGDFKFKVVQEKTLDFLISVATITYKEVPQGKTEHNSPDGSSKESK